MEIGTIYRSTIDAWPFSDLRTEDDDAFLFGVIIGILRKDIERGRMVQESFSYLPDISSLARALIVDYLLIVSVLLLWPGFNQPETLDTLFYGENGLFMLFMVLSPLIIPVLWKVIKLDLEEINMSG